MPGLVCLLFNVLQGSHRAESLGFSYDSVDFCEIQAVPGRGGEPAHDLKDGAIGSVACVIAPPKKLKRT